MNKFEGLRTYFGEVLNRRNSIENGNLMTSMLVCSGAIVGALSILLEGPRAVDIATAATPTFAEAGRQAVIYMKRLDKQERREKIEKLGESLDKLGFR